MEEKIYSTKKNGMKVLLFCILAGIIGIFLLVVGGISMEDGGIITNQTLSVILFIAV